MKVIICGAFFPHGFGVEGVVEHAVVDVDQDGAMVVSIVLAELGGGARDLEDKREFVENSLKKLRF